MLSSLSVANYFLSKDTDRVLFDKRLVRNNGRSFYAGNARLNKYLHLAQNLFIAKTGEKLFEDDLYAYDNGAVVPSVQENYSILVTRQDVPDIPANISAFLDKVYQMLANASLEELIELSHEDSEWVDKQRYYRKEDQRMNSIAHATEYREQYRDVLKVMDRMTV